VTTLTLHRSHLPFWPLAGLAVVAWAVAWFICLPLADWIAFDLLGLETGTQLGDAVAFFLYDVPKVLLLLLGIVTVITFIRSYFPPERMRAALAGHGTLPATVGAAGFGVVTPFCSCSAVPLFIGFVEAGIPLGVTFSFLIAAPMVNEIALVLLYGMFGLQVAALYLVTGLVIAIVAGWVIGHLRMDGFVEAGIPMGVTFAFLISSPMVNEVALVLLWGLFGPGVALLYMAAGLAVAIVGGLVLGHLGVERWVEPWVLEVRTGGGATSIALHLTVEQRLRDAWAYTKDLVWKVLPFVLVGIGIGAFIHGFVPTDLVVQVGGSDNPLAVPIVVLLAVPLYSSAAGTIPIVEALLGKGLPLGTTLAFMMAIVAISLPEFVILRRVIRPRLIALFATVVVVGILIVGLLFNALGI
jgi:uncharacterized membrane protein YraQ (UPF0718 family)